MYPSWEERENVGTKVWFLAKTCIQWTLGITTLSSNMRKIASWYREKFWKYGWIIANRSWQRFEKIAGAICFFLKTFWEVTDLESIKDLFKFLKTKNIPSKHWVNHLHGDFEICLWCGVWRKLEMLNVLDFWLCLLVRFHLLTISLGCQCMCMSWKDGGVCQF